MSRSPSSDSSDSSDSEESYTTRILAGVKRQEEQLDRAVSSSLPSLWRYLQNDPSSSFSFGSRSSAPEACWVLESTSRQQYSDTDPLMHDWDDRQMPSRPSQSIWRPRTPERPSKTWLTGFQEFWDTILICFGLKSVNSPY
ncbi:hypothetical protein HD806DRAFT_242331 [Xylariaceae sp. AK1471]|nr:hypothetical protein HD806DRAFT_242331 [Xylariaceae sp. AK1471]